MSLWRFLPASLAHELGPTGVRIAAEIFGCEKSQEWNPLRWRGLHFPNRVGIAGGVDKNGENLRAWQRLGAGFIEMGTVTPKPQQPNPGKILDRDWERKNLWNKMGFPSDGATEARLNWQAAQPLDVPVFINIGKNRETPNEKAVDDYVRLVREFPFAQGFVVNVSSPNTMGLRALQTREFLQPLCHTVTHAAVPRPVLLKLSPDMSETDFKDCIDAGLSSGIAGFVLTNTTTQRPTGCPFPTEGGLSGQDLRERSRQALRWANAMITPRGSTLLVSVGGIFTLDDVKKSLELGADLVEVYSALIFRGPLFFKKLQREFSRQKNK